jgi:HK97 family phage major capsid protein
MLLALHGVSLSAPWRQQESKKQMLQSVQISRRQSAIRGELAALSAKEQPSADEVRALETLDAEYGVNEKRFRAALISEDSERRDAKADLETRGDREYSNLISKFELRQVVLNLDEGRTIDGATAEVVSELRNKGGYRGVPVPFEALEMRSGETIASGVPDPIAVMPVIDRIFANSAAGKMGTRFINIDSGGQSYPLTSSSVTAGWAATETGNVAGPTAYSTSARALNPNQTLGITMTLTRNAMKQTGDALEAAVRRDMSGCMGDKMDSAVFLGAGSSGEPAGILVGSYSITSTSVGAAASWAAFRGAVKRFLIANAATGPGDVNLLIRPEVWDSMDGTLITNTAVSEFDRMSKNISNIVMSSNALAAPTGSPLASKALLTTSIGGVPPSFVGTWGAIDLIRDVFTKAASGQVVLTGLVTMDVSAGRAAQLQILTGVQ